MPEYGNVVLTLGNVSLPSEKLYPNLTPSMSEGLSYEIEYDLRLIGCELIQTACLLLKLPQTAVATGQVLFHRYFYSSSFVRRQMEIVAMACTNLAAKIEEDARRIRDVINVFNHIKQVRAGKTIRPILLDQVYLDRKNEVIKAERRLLKELGFCVYVKHPHKMITMYLKVLEKEREKDLVQTAWNYMNDSLRTDIFLRLTPETIACACIDLAARTLHISLPKNPPWYVIFGAEPEQIHYIMFAILRLYNHRPKSLDELEKLVNIVREKREDERKKLRPDLIPSIDIDNDPSSQSLQLAQNTISSTVIHTTTVIQQDASNTVQEISNGTTNGKVLKKDERKNSRETSNHRSRRKRSRSSSRSQKKKKTSHRSRSRSRSSSSRREKHRHRYHSSNRRKKEKKRRSYSVSSEENHNSKNYNKPPLSTKDTNHHHHSNGVSSSRKKLRH